MEKTPLKELTENIQLSTNGSVSKEQAEVFQNKTPVNNKDLPSNPSADITGSKEEWKNHEKENIKNQLIHNQKDVDVHEDQNPKLQIQDISANGTFSVENSFYLEESNITPLNITGISDNFVNALSFSDEIQQENVSVHQDNYFGEVVEDDIKNFASEFHSTSETIVFEDETTSDGNSTAAKRCNDVNKTSENAGGSSVVMNSTFEFKDEQKTEYGQGSEVASCDNKNSHYPENVSEVKPEQKLTDSKNNDIAYVENLAEVPDQNNTKNETEKSRSQSENGERCLEITVKQIVSESNVNSVAAVENSNISPLKHQIQYENKPADDVQSSPDEFNLTFEHEFEQTVILHNESTQKEPMGDDVYVPLDFEKKNSMSEQELEQNCMSVSNGVNDRDSSSHCDTELQTKQQENESSSDNVGSFPSSTSCEINLAPELEQKDAIICDDVAVVENNTSSRVSKGNGICNNINAVELPPEGNLADQGVDVINEKGVEEDGWKEKSSCKPRNSVLLGFDPMYSQKSPNTTITEENCESGSSGLEDVLLFSNHFGKANIVIETTKLNNQELQESEAFFDAVMSDDATNIIGNLLDISQIPPESKEEIFIQEECNNSNPVFSLNEIAEVNTISGFEDSLNEAKIINSDTKAIEKNRPSKDELSKKESGKTTADVSGKSAIQEEINAELKLQLSASQQSNAILELQLQQKENVILKNQEDTLRKDEAYSQEIEQLKKKLEYQRVVSDNTEAKELQDAIKSVKNRETKLISELNSLKNNEQNYRKIMDEYENTVGTQVEQLKNLSEEHETVKRHLANLEMAFSDVHQKYERSKKIIDGYKCNEVALRQTLITSEESVIKSEQKYESLKSHAKAQIEKSNQAMHLMRQQSEAEIHKLTAIIKRLEITNASLKESLDQKKKECSALAALCDEVTGNV